VVKKYCENISPSPGTEIDLDAFPQIDDDGINDQDDDENEIEDTPKKISIKENTKSSKSFKSLYSKGDESVDPSMKSSSVKTVNKRKKRKSSPSLRDDSNKLIFFREEGTIYENSTIFFFEKAH
jgi:hypothetical protein